MKLTKTILSLPSISSLAVGSIILFSKPALSTKLFVQNFTENVSPTIGYTATYIGLDDRPLNFLTYNSPEFPETVIKNNNTNKVEITFTGKPQPLGTPYTVEFEVEDYRDGTAGFNFPEYVAIVDTPTGIEKLQRGALGVKTKTSLDTSNNIFTAAQITVEGELNGTTIERKVTYQVPGNEITYSNLAFPVPVTLSVSTQPIAGYGAFEQLEEFPPPKTYTVLPGGTISVDNQSIPEPLTISGSVLFLSFGAFFKKKLFNKTPKLISGTCQPQRQNRYYKC